MTNNNPAFYTVKVLTEMAWDILYFPFWWYTQGLLETIQALKTFLEYKEKAIGLFVWMKNIFTPMYGQEDFAGKLISFIMRVFQIIVRGMAMLFWLVLASLAICLWILVPFVAVYEIIFQLF